jgi:hypothetical protein
MPWFVKQAYVQRLIKSVPMKKFSPPQMKEVSFPTPHTLHPLSSQDGRQKRVIEQKEAMGCYYLKPIPRKQPNRSSGSIPWRIVVE